MTEQHPPTAVWNPLKRNLPASEGQRIQVRFDWVDLRDVASSMIAAEKRGKTGENYLLPGHYATVEELAGMAAATSGVEVTARKAPMWLARMTAPFGKLFGGSSNLNYTPDALHALRYSPPISGAKAATELGHKPRPTSDSVRDVYQWFSRRGDLEGEA